MMIDRQQYQQPKQKQRRFIEGEGEVYSNFINSVNSEVTRREYSTNFTYFMKYCSRGTHEDMLGIPIHSTRKHGKRLYCTPKT